MLLFWLLVNFGQVECGSGRGRNKDSGVSVRVGIIMDGERTSWTSSSLNFISRAVDIINSRQDLTPGVTLSYGPIFSGNSTFKLSKSICSGLGSGVRALMGPSQSLASRHVHSIATGLGRNTDNLSQSEGSDGSSDQSERDRDGK